MTDKEKKPGLIKKTATKVTDGVEKAMDATLGITNKTVDKTVETVKKGYNATVGIFKKKSEN